jgi:hypothetical protein
VASQQRCPSQRASPPLLVSIPESSIGARGCLENSPLRVHLKHLPWISLHSLFQRSACLLLAFHFSQKKLVKLSPLVLFASVCQAERLLMVFVLAFWEVGPVKLSLSALSAL